MAHHITFAELRQFLLALGCSENVSATRTTFACSTIGTFLLFRPYGQDEPVSNRDLIVVRRQLVDNGMVEAPTFDRFLKKPSMSNRARGIDMTSEEHQRNQYAYRSLKDALKTRFPMGHYVAIAEGKIVGDADDFMKLYRFLKSSGRDPSQAVIVQAGHEYLEKAAIL